MPNRICRAGIARTFQIPRPFRKLSILENASLAAFYGSGERISAAEAQQRGGGCAGMVGLPTSADAQVDGLGAAGLKKLEMARALATQPQLLLADESLGGLDEQEMEQAADMLSRIRRERGITIIWVEHIMGVLMRVVDRCIVLDHGEVIAEGSPTEVANHPKVIEVYLGTDAAEVQDQVSGAPGGEAARRIGTAMRRALTRCARSAPATAASRRSSMSTSRCAPARRWRCSGPTARARRRCCGSSRG